MNMTQSGDVPDDDSPGAFLGALPAILWRRRWIVAGCTLAFLAGGLLYVLVASKTYTGTARLSVLAPARPAQTSAAITDSAAGAYLETEKELILSPSVLSLAAQSPAVAPLIPPGVNPITFLEDGLSVETGKRSTVITVRFLASEPGAAAKVANAVANAYIRYQTAPKPADAAEREHLAREHDRLAAEISDKTRRMTELEQKYGILSTSADHDAVVQKHLASIQQDLDAARTDALRAQVDFQEASAAIEHSGKAAAPAADPLPVAPSGVDEEQNIRNQLTSLEANLEQLRQHYLPDHPYVRTMRERVNALKAAYARAVEQRYLLAREREKDLQASLEAARQQAVDQGARAALYLRLQTDLADDRKTADQIDSRRREIEIAHDLGMLNIDFFDPAKPAEKPSHPDVPSALLIALVLGIVTGGGLGCLRDWFDDRFRSIDEMGKATGLRTLGTLPRMRGDLSVTAAGRQVVLASSSAMAEACRLLRTSIKHFAPEDRNCSILITSPDEKAGKSVLAGNLAITLAKAGERILLLDANLRTPAQHAIFSARNNQGLLNVLDGRRTSDEVIQRTAVERLDVLPGGPRAYQPAELLNSPLFSDLLEILSDRYDRIIIDAPAVNDVADARIIAACSDLTILVLRADQSTRRETDAACRGLLSVGADVLGVVINDAASADRDPIDVSSHATRRTGASKKRKARPASSKAPQA